MRKLRVLDLFSGIGGFSLGLERTDGFETVAFCEIEDYPRRVLAKHWPKVPCYHDVRTLTADTLARDGIAVDVICGGFPCQDISTAGKGAGIAGERSGLWREYARLIGEIRPQFVLVENVAALLGRGLGDVLGALAALGYDAEWHCIPASAVGAPHERDRLWIVAYPNTAERGEKRCPCDGLEIGEDGLSQREKSSDRFEPSREALANATQERCREARKLRREQPTQWTRSSGTEVADAMRSGLANRRPPGFEAGTYAYQWGMALAQSQRRGRAWWAIEPGMDRVANGVPNRTHRIAGLGNAVVPEIPQLIGQAILESLKERAAA